MFRLPLIMIIPLLALSFSLEAQTRIYGCKRDGIVIFDTKPMSNCDVVKIFSYPRYKKSEIQGLRPEEIRALKALEYDIGPSLSRRFENVDERVGWAKAESLFDTRHDKCAYYYAKLYKILALLGIEDSIPLINGYGNPRYHPTIIRPEIRMGQLTAELEFAQEQVNYYCP